MRDGLELVGMVQSVPALDPRSIMDNRTLMLASRNAFPVVGTRVARRDGMGLAAGACGALLLGGVTFWSMSGSRAPLPENQSPVEATVAEPPADPVAASVPVVVAKPTGPSLPAAAPVGRGAGVGPAGGLDRANAPVMVLDASVPFVPPAIGRPTSPAPAAPKMAATGLSDNEGFAARVGGDVPDAVSAVPMINPASTITQGTLIAAVLETAIDSDLPGYARAIVAQDVRSFDGSRILVPRSSRVIGQYKSGLAAGQTRAYVVWTRIIRPDGASVALSSPATDYAGRSGLSGETDGHFLKRFGSAMLLSVVGSLSALGGGGTAVVLSNGGTSAATVAAQRDAQIPPTIRIRQGQPIRIFTARDLDFSSLGFTQ